MSFRKISDKVLTPLNKQIFYFVLVGFVCYVISIVLLMVLVEILQAEVNLANLIASVLTILICYYLNSRFIFESGKYNLYREIMTFVVFSLIGLAINVSLMYLMTKFLPIWYVVSKTIVTLIVAAFNFTTRKWIIFKN